MFFFVSLLYAVACWLRSLVVALAGALGVGVLIGWLVRRAA